MKVELHHRRRLGEVKVELHHRRSLNEAEVELHHRHHLGVVKAELHHCHHLEEANLHHRPPLEVALLRFWRGGFHYQASIELRDGTKQSNHRTWAWKSSSVILDVRDEEALVKSLILHLNDPS